MHRSRRSSFVALVLAIVLAGAAAACGGSRFEEQSGSADGAVPASLPPVPAEATVPGSVVATTATLSPVASSTTLPALPTGPAGPLPSAPSTTVAPPPTPAPAPPPTPAPQVRSPELVRWCPVAGEGLRVLLQSATLTPDDFEQAAALFRRVQELAPAPVRPAMDKVMPVADTFFKGAAAGEVSTDWLADVNASRAFIDGKLGPGSFDGALAALKQVYDYGVANC